MTWSAIAFARRHGTLIGVALVILYFWLHLPATFLTGRNLLNISQQMSMLAVVASTMTIVMAMGDFDLSAGSMASLGGIVAALVFISGGSVAVAVGVALMAGLAGGLINGLLVAYVGILAVHRDPRRDDCLRRPCLLALGRQDPVWRRHSAQLLRVRRVGFRSERTWCFPI